MTTPDGEAEELTAADLEWAVRPDNFPSRAEMRHFLVSRRAFLAAADRAGVPREALLAFEPNRPGFEDRVKTAFGAFLTDPEVAAE